MLLVNSNGHLAKRGVGRHHFSPLRMKRIYVIQGPSPYRAVNTLHLGYKKQIVKVLKVKM